MTTSSPGPAPSILVYAVSPSAGDTWMTAACAGTGASVVPRAVDRANADSGLRRLVKVSSRMGSSRGARGSPRTGLEQRMLEAYRVALGRATRYSWPVTAAE